MSAKTTERNVRRTVQGTVTSDKMDKTITVTVNRHVRHAKYGKYVRRRTKYHAQDEKGEAKVGDVVEIAETRRVSKTKCWRLVRVVRRAETV